ncbi:GSCFA family protein [Frigidibacter albus]|uniref:GSCFA family protein n=1 Tax=Frigidibacter albus TaxID=1465486 RepID=A0A6L8VIS6_9RHOB|nr:GSCFA domain-containing protein [Frigidibacter albus]MZQ89080.1 GSCFA family protein [Frigidibacter albus]NBE30863.1 GSCFA family protein [Frigidibacter albus]GGH51572.1 hypothetical protein GCM10011341_15290 [Frigidibacter albus]
MTPYDDLPQSSFWRPAVAERDPLQIEGLWTPKFRIARRDRIVTAGSCFAQHIGRALAARGYHWLDAEPAPSRLAEALRGQFHYGTFSFRTGNIYTTNMLAQWLDWAFGDTPPPEDLWDKDGRVFDPFRPAVEPGGFVTREEALASRAATLSAIRRAVTQADVFVFTLGLTESWQHSRSGVEYAICPGTVAGKFRPRYHRFVNQGYDAVLSRMRDALALLRTHNPRLRVLLTVSPVPLTATASGTHVLNATSYSKSVLRAVAGTLAQEDPGVDYFPSYEIITGTPFRGMFYAGNLRSVLPEGVGFVMDSFFADQARVFGAPATAEPTPTPETRAERQSREETEQGDAEAALHCEEELLGAFAK